MQALIAYKHSTNPDLVAIEIRQMTCFNGLNTSNAFATKNNNASFDVTVLNRGTANSCEINPPRPTTGQWDVIGLGWLSHLATSSMSADNIPQHMSGNREIVAMLLNLEHVTGQYLNNQSYVMATGTRERTPNEILIGRTVMALTVRSANPRGAFWKACQYNTSYQRSLFDFVGSERPSGAAVAYLQVYRNTSNNLTAPLSPKLSAANALLHHIDPRGALVAAGTFKSFIPLLSRLFNNGSDSDIFSFSETPYITLQGLHHGVFSLAPFFSDSRPMTQEGRYAKGSQSDSLRRNVVERATRLNLNNADHRITIIESFEALRSIEEAANFSSMMINPTAAQNNITRAWETYNRVSQGRPFNATVTNFASLVAGFADIRQANVSSELSASTERVAGSSVNFHQWVAQATQETPAS